MSRRVVALDRYGQTRVTPKSKVPPRPPSAVRDTVIPHESTVPLNEMPGNHYGSETPQRRSKGSERPKKGVVIKNIQNPNRGGSFRMPVTTDLQRRGFLLHHNVVEAFFGGIDFETHLVRRLNNWNEMTSLLRGPHYQLKASEAVALQDIMDETDDEGFQYRTDSSPHYKFCLRDANNEPLAVAFDTGDYVAFSPKYKRIAGYQKFLIPIEKRENVVSMQFGATIITESAVAEGVTESLLQRIHDDIVTKASDNHVVLLMGMDRIHEGSPVHRLGDMLRLTLGMERIHTDL